MPDQPNVLLIIADQWRGSDQGWRGNREVLTPHLDRLAENGVGIPGAYANAPVCGPSRGCLFTGQMPHRHGVVANDLPLTPGIPTIADVFSAAGYQTGWVGKWHLDGLPRDKWVAPERRRGFKYWAGTNCAHDYFDAHYYTGDDPAPVPFSGYEAHVHTDLALQFMAENKDLPFFLTVSYNPPHDPYEDVPDEYLSRYDGAALTPRENADTSQGLLRLYYAGITAADEQIGRLVGGLEALGLTSDTLVVVTSDHGDMLGSHGRQKKQVPFEEAVSVPLVFSWPGRLAPREALDGVFGLVDLSPTVLGLAGLPGLPDSYGGDLSNAISGGGSLREAVLLLNAVSVDEGYRQGVGEWRGVRTNTWTYARHVDGKPWLLFDNERDPWQQQNMVADRHAVAEMDRLLDDLLHEAGDVAASAEDTIRHLDLVDAWNAREREMHGNDARLLSLAE